MPNCRCFGVSSLIDTSALVADVFRVLCGSCLHPAAQLADERHREPCKQCCVSGAKEGAASASARISIPPHLTWLSSLFLPSLQMKQLVSAEIDFGSQRMRFQHSNCIYRILLPCICWKAGAHSLRTVLSGWPTRRCCMLWMPRWIR